MLRRSRLSSGPRRVSLPQNSRRHFIALTVRLNEEQERALEKLAADTGRTKSYYVKQARDQFLETRADYLAEVGSLENPRLRGKGAQTDHMLEAFAEVGLVLDRARHHHDHFGPVDIVSGLTHTPQRLSSRSAAFTRSSRVASGRWALGCPA